MPPLVVAVNAVGVNPVEHFHAVTGPLGHLGTGSTGIEAAAEQHASYFDFSYLKQLVPAAGPEHPKPGSPARFLGFAPDFAYRYVKVSAITASQAQALGEHYARHAARYAKHVVLTCAFDDLPCHSTCWNSRVDVLSSRILLRPSDLDRSRRFYRDVLGLAIYREFGPPDDPGVVFFLGLGLLEVSGHAAGPGGHSVRIWIQVRNVQAEHARLEAAGVSILRRPAMEPWGLIEMWIEDPDGVRIVLVEVPADHPLRRDPRSASPPR